MEENQNIENTEPTPSVTVSKTPCPAPEVSCAPQTPLPDEIKKFNWGAFFLTWIWGIGNNSYITLFAFLAYFVASVANSLGVVLPFCLAFNIYCGVMGNQWAWKNKTWESTEYFNRVQKRWAIGGVLFFILTRILTTLLIVSMFALMFYLLYPSGNINKFEDWAHVGKKGITYFTKYAVESTLEGTNMSTITNSNELAREIASGLDTKSLGNTIFISNNGKVVLKVYKDGDCKLEKKNCSVQLDSLTSSNSNSMKNFKFYIDENKKLIPAEKCKKCSSKI